MTTVSSKNAITYDFDWPPNMFLDDEYNIHHNDNDAIGYWDTHTDVDRLCANQNPEMSQINKKLNQYYILSNEMSIVGTMNEINLNYPDNDDNTRWKDKLWKHKKANNFDFSSLQKRIENVKNDIIVLSNKLNPGLVLNSPETPTKVVNKYYNLEFGNMKSNELHSVNSPKEPPESVRQNKTWKCPSQFISANPFSDLSENTQKILNRLNLNEETPRENLTKETASDDDVNEDDLDMEEDDIEFTFCTNSTGLIVAYLNKGTLPIIEETEEFESCSEEDKESFRSTIIDNFKLDTETLESPKSMSLRSIDFTESESYFTAFTNPIAENQDVLDGKSSSFEDVEENFSDYARYSVSSDSSKDSFNSGKMEKIDILTVTERTLTSAESNYDDIHPVKRIGDYSASSMKVNESSDSDAEYDHSTWSSEDILQSVEQSDSLYENPVKSSLKASLPDLIESSDNYNYFLSNRNLNKSTDLDEIMLQHQSPYHQTPMTRLSLSLCNLNANKMDKAHPKHTHQDAPSQSNLLETDLDSGFVSIYQQNKEMENLPSTDLSSSLININQDKNKSNSIVERLRNKACSIPELRIAESLNKLTLPEWLQFKQDEVSENVKLKEENIASYQSEDLNELMNIRVQSPIKKLLYSPQHTEPIIIDQPIKSQSVNTFVLPTQKLRQSSQKKLTPIKTCKAREFLSPKIVLMEVI